MNQNFLMNQTTGTLFSLKLIHSSKSVSAEVCSIPSFPLVGWRIGIPIGISWFLDSNSLINAGIHSRKLIVDKIRRKLGLRVAFSFNNMLAYGKKESFGC